MGIDSPSSFEFDGDREGSSTTWMVTTKANYRRAVLHTRRAPWADHALSSVLLCRRGSARVEGGEDRKWEGQRAWDR